MRNVRALIIVASLWAIAGSAFAAEPKTQSETAALSAEQRLRTQAVIRDLVDNGETDVDELVDTIAAENYEKLDHLVINLATQTIYECNLAGQVLNTSKVSTGRSGYTTPTGNYKVHNRAQKAYSQKYNAWMLNWMGFTSDGSYGIHGLEGSSYERHLGSVASHGCVRLSRKYAKDLYTRVKVGMPVKIVNDKDLKLPEYMPISREAAMSMVLEVLSPADPWEIFY